MVLTAARAVDMAPWAWSVLLAATLIVVVALSRAGSALFWRTSEAPGSMPVPRVSGRALCAVGGLLACVVGLVVWGGTVTEYSRDTARQLADPSGYRRAVLSGPDGPATDDRRSLR
jgi:multicomponent K+:H+ antiporter subunit D